MLEVKINKGECQIVANGSLLELLTEVSILIGSLHARVKKADSEMGDVFRAKLLTVLVNPKSAVWDTEGALENAIGSSILINKSELEKQMKEEQS